MALPERSLTILDVGHGNCAVLIDPQGTLVIDAGPGTALLEFLEFEGINSIDVILISHADKDHLSGLLAIIGSKKINIGCVRLNTDSLKGSRIWNDLAYELDKAKESNEIDFEPSLTKCPSGTYDQGETQVEIIAPSAYLAMKGPGSTDKKGRKLSTNSISAVVRLLYKNLPIAILTGDLDDIGLDDLIEHGANTSAPILLFPHHGGKPDAKDMIEFTNKICATVDPQTVVFSIGRGSYNTPRPEIIKTIQKKIPNARIACTQLSKHCSTSTKNLNPKHLHDTFSHGLENNCCCTGTIVINLDDPENMRPNPGEHSEFISTYASTALCKVD